MYESGDGARTTSEEEVIRDLGKEIHFSVLINGALFWQKINHSGWRIVDFTNVYGHRKVIKCGQKLLVYSPYAILFFFDCSKF